MMNSNASDYDTFNPLSQTPTDNISNTNTNTNTNLPGSLSSYLTAASQSKLDTIKNNLNTISQDDITTPDSNGIIKVKKGSLLDIQKQQQQQPLTLNNNKNKSNNETKWMKYYDDVNETDFYYNEKSNVSQYERPNSYRTPREGIFDIIFLFISLYLF